MKISLMGFGSPILNSKHGVRIPADRRVYISKTKRIKEELENIKFQKELLQKELNGVVV